MKHYFTMRTSVRELERLSNHELKDIGLTREDIKYLDRKNKFFPALWKSIKEYYYIRKNQDVVAEYLAQSVDRMDLEVRKKELIRKGYLPW